MKARTWRAGADLARRGRPWSLPLEDRVLLVAAYWRTNLTLRQPAPLFGVSKSAADRIIDHLGPSLALQPRKRFRKDTVLIVDGTLDPTRDHITTRHALEVVGPTSASAAVQEHREHHVRRDKPADAQHGGRAGGGQGGGSVVGQNRAHRPQGPSGR